MCLAVPGKIVEIKKDIAIIDYGLEKRNGRIIEGDYKAGDYVLIQGGIVIQKIPEQEAIEALEMYKNLKSEN